MLRLLERIDCTFCQMVFPDWSDMSDAHLQMTLRSSLGVGNVYQLCRLKNYFHDIFYKIMFGRMTCLGNDIPHLLPAHLGWVVIDMCAGCMCIADHSASVAFAACCSGSCEWKGSSLKSVQHNFGIFLCVLSPRPPHSPQQCHCSHCLEVVMRRSRTSFALCGVQSPQRRQYTCNHWLQVLGQTLIASAHLIISV